MSGKTRIVVLRMKEILTTLLFVAIGIVLVIFLITTFAKKHQNTQTLLPDSSEAESEEGSLEGALYIPGTYSTEIVLGKNSVILSVTVAKDTITSIELGEQSPEVATLYPLLEPTLADINNQLAETGSIESVTSNAGNRYTSMVLMRAIESSLNRAKVSENEMQEP